jgi:hypothetical protein
VRPCVVERRCVKAGIAGVCAPELSGIGHPLGKYDWGDCGQCERGSCPVQSVEVGTPWCRASVFTTSNVLAVVNVAGLQRCEPTGSRRLVPGVTSSADRCSSVDEPATAIVTVPTRSRAMDDTSRVKPPTVYSTCLATSCEVRFTTLRSVFCHTTKYLVRRTLNELIHWSCFHFDQGTRVMRTVSIFGYIFVFYFVSLSISISMPVFSCLYYYSFFERFGRFMYSLSPVSIFYFYVLLFLTSSHQ